MQAAVLQSVGARQDDRLLPWLFRLRFGPRVEPPLARHADRALRELLGSVPSVDEAVRFLESEFDRRLTEPRVTIADRAGELDDAWVWDPGSRTARLRRLPAGTGELYQANQLAVALLAINPTLPSRRRYAISQLGLSKAIRGLSQPLDRADPAVSWIAAHYRVSELEAVLHWALTHQFTPTALAAAELLGDRGAVAHDVQPSESLVAALGSPSPRVRFAAADAIMRIDPRRLFAGASKLVDVAVQAVATSGQRRVLVVDPRESEARPLAGLFRQLGLNADVVSDGKSAMRLLVESPDYELLVVSDEVYQPTWTSLIQQLRFDYRSAAIPLAIVTRKDSLDDVEYQASLYARTLAFSFPYGPNSLNTLVSQIYAFVGEEPITPRGANCPRPTFAAMAVSHRGRSPFLRVLRDWRPSPRVCRGALSRRAGASGG